jgi:hypothetical protein
MHFISIRHCYNPLIYPVGHLFVIKFSFCFLNTYNAKQNFQGLEELGH